MVTVNAVGVVAPRDVAEPATATAQTPPPTPQGVVPLGPAASPIAGASSKLLPGIPAPQVAMRIRADEGGGTRRVFLPASAFNLTGGKPTRLAGPFVTVIADAPIHAHMDDAMSSSAPGDQAIASTTIPTTATADGQFDAVDVDVAQTTPFYAAQRVHDWAMRTAGRPIDWKGSSLPVTVHAYVTSAVQELNAAYALGAKDAGISLGAYGSIRDGKPAPYSGRGVSILDKARQLISKGYHDEPVADTVVQHRSILLAELERAIADDDLIKARRLINGEMKTEPPRRAETPALDNLPADQRAVFEAAFAGREGWFITLDIARARLAVNNDVKEAFYDTATDRRIVAHEAGHAALHAMKPALSTPAGLAFHEAYGDLAKIGATLDDPESVAAILEETGGDLSKSSSATRIIDELEDVVRTSQTQAVHMKRDASFKSIVDYYGPKPDVLLASTDAGVMPEAHNLSELISSSVYELLAQRATQELAPVPDDQRIATVQRVNEEIGTVVNDSTVFMPESGGNLGDVLNSVVAAARHHDRTPQAPQLAPALIAILKGRGVDLPAPAPVPAVTIAPNAKTDEVLNHATINDMLMGWPPPAGATKLPVEDVTNARGLRVVRVRYQRADTKESEGRPPIWSAAFAFDERGALVAASAAAP